MQVFQPKEVLQNNFTEDTEDQEYNTTVGPLLITHELQGFKFEEDDETTFAKSRLDDRIRAITKSGLRMQNLAGIESHSSLGVLHIEDQITTSRGNLMIATGERPEGDLEKYFNSPINLTDNRPPTHMDQRLTPKLVDPGLKKLTKQKSKHFKRNAADSLPYYDFNGYVHRAENSDNLVEVSIADMINTKDLKVPMIKLNDTTYLFGTEILQPFMHGNTCVVRIGGGFEPIEQYAMRSQEQHRRAYKKIMIKEEKSYIGAIEDILMKNLNSKPRVGQIMHKMQLYFIRQGCLHYEQPIPEVMELINDSALRKNPSFKNLMLNMPE